MATATKSRTNRSRTAKSTEPKPEATETPTPEVTEARTPAQPTYRQAPDFTPALKSAKAAAKGNVDLMQPLQLITHLAWKSPAGTVGWAKGTTPTVVAYAEDIAVPAGTAIPDAMQAALSAARKAATDDPQKDAVGALSKVIEGHTS